MGWTKHVVRKDSSYILNAVTETQFIIQSYISITGIREHAETAQFLSGNVGAIFRYCR